MVLANKTKKKDMLILHENSMEEEKEY